MKFVSASRTYIIMNRCSNGFCFEKMELPLTYFENDHLTAMWHYIQKNPYAMFEKCFPIENFEGFEK